MNKKSQLAMEFLMTYGWAILVVLAAIAALAYFGILSPENWIDVEKTKETKYCLEWDGWIKRENLWHNCIDFEQLKGTCDYTIDSNNFLSVRIFVPDGEDRFYNYNCTKYVIAMEVLK